MMSELLAMLTPGSPELRPDMIRGTSKNKISAGDVAACLVHVDRHTYLYALAKFCLDTNAQNELNDLARAEAAAMDYRTEVREPDNVVDRLALVALDYSILPGRCMQCGGTGELNIRSIISVCHRCHGSGNFELSVRGLSKVLGVGRWRAQRVWMARFQALVSDYQVRDDALHIVIRRGLQGE
tara:strand:- start:360 stop:908 length:549 start_codon:yes stop_codon:yes gene_type:complete